MAFSLIAQTVDVLGANGGTTTEIDSSGANLLLFVSSWYFGVVTQVSFTDSKSNSWNGLTAIDDNAEAKVRIWWSVPTTVGSGHTANIADTGSFCTGALYAFSGADATPFDQESGSDGDHSQPGSITPAGSDYLFLAVGGIRAGTSYSWDSGFTSDSVGYGSGANEGLVVGYKILTGSAAAQNPTLDTTGALAMATFQVSSGANVTMTPDVYALSLTGQALTMTVALDPRRDGMIWFAKS